jgi:hypothetical protein
VKRLSAAKHPDFFPRHLVHAAGLLSIYNSQPLRTWIESKSTESKEDGRANGVDEDRGGSGPRC